MPKPGVRERRAGGGEGACGAGLARGGSRAPASLFDSRGVSDYDPG